MILLLDCNFLAWRSFHTTGKLSHNDKPTGVIFGFLSALRTLHEQFSPEKIGFCFDSPGRLKRHELCSTYKQRAITPDQDRREVSEQIQGLRCEWLKELGYGNVFWQEGYEADDVIASIIHNQLHQDFIIVSADKDLWQLLRRGEATGAGTVELWNPIKQELYSNSKFEEEWGIPVKLWSTVKAFAGCKSDNVEGIPGVGEITAAKYLDCRLSTKRMELVAEKIRQFDDGFERNLKLVKLPFPGVKTFEWREDETSSGKWKKFCEKFGMKTLASRGLPRARSLYQ
jgi:DNA polymerase-1